MTPSKWIGKRNKMDLESRLTHFVKWLDNKGISIEPFLMHELIEEYINS